MATFDSSLKSRFIYIFAINDEYHKDCLKIGETTLDQDISAFPQPNDPLLLEAAHKRIDQYTQTAGIAYSLLWTEMTVYIANGSIQNFNDKQVHKILERSGIKKKVFDKVKGANEWFCCDLNTAKQAIQAAKQGHTSLLSNQITQGQSPIIFRPEQRKAIDMTIRQFRKGNQMLWNAKMRFGKTLSALQVVKEEQYARTLILTHRPVVDEGWFDDFHKIFYDSPNYHYGSRTNGESFESLQNLAAKGEKYVYFVSMQDMRGSDEVGGRFAKDSDIYQTPWDMLIIDEAHEGTTTSLGAAVINKLTKPATKVLRLSGTPFNLLDNYKENEIFTWDYIMEQKAKTQWDLIHMGDPNPYAELPAINIYTYDLGRLMDTFADDEKAFNFREFFRTRDDGSFIYDSDISNFLNLLCKDDPNSLYPYSNAQFRNIFRHTLWIVPGVKAAQALSKKLQSHPVFGTFKIVNVAGNGDEDEENADALKLVNNAIGPDPGETWTITLSCGKLTTGVSIKPWTAVFMMAGSYSTSAASYMQTIFRVQTPFTYHGKMKTNCYAFDFAPDRTLRVLAETAHVSAKAGKQSEQDRQILGEFLNFCPIISIEGSQMKQYDVSNMMGQLKRAQIDRVVRDGFEDGALYSDELLMLQDVDLQNFKDLKGIIGQTKAMAKTADIDINSQGLTNEEYKEKAKLQKKPKKQLTAEEQKRLEELKKKKTQRMEAISILRGISIRMPLLIYGAELENEDDEITIDNFATLVDDKSWAEFMPNGVTKQIFSTFKRYYDPDILREAGKRIREMARAADKFTIEERIERIATIFNTFRNPDKETVLTPWRVVNMHMGDCLGGYCFYDKDFSQKLDIPRYISHKGITDDIFHPDSLILEINSKSGLYPLYCAYNIYRSRVEAMQQKYGEIGHAFAQSLWDATIEQNIFVVCKTPMAVSITKRTLAGFRPVKVNAQYYPNLVKQISQNQATVVNALRDGKHFWHINNNTDMKFKAIVGNPPYQENTTSKGFQGVSIYSLFIDTAILVKPKYVSLITPSRWMTKGSMGISDNWVENKLNSNHFISLYDYIESQYLFKSVGIGGGVNYFLFSESYNGKCNYTLFQDGQKYVHAMYLNHLNAGIVIRDGHAETIINCIREKEGDYYNNNNFTSLVGPLHFFDRDVTLGTNWKGYSTVKDDEHPIKCYINKRLEKCGYGWIKRSDVAKNHDTIGIYKVYLPKAYGTAGDPYVIGTPFLGEPNSACSFSYIVIAYSPIKHNFSKVQCENIINYMKSRLFRYLVTIRKKTQDNPCPVFQFVPLQDFTPSSDIDWSQPVADIDRQLYNKYGLNRQEIDFIERTIKPMP